MLIAIVAHDTNYGIGNRSGLPWPKNYTDLARVRELTEGHTVVYGRKTLVGSPLPNRKNIVLSRDGGDYSVEDVLKLSDTEKVFVLGGAEIYDLFAEFLDGAFVTYIRGSFECDTFLGLKFQEFMRTSQRTPLQDNVTYFGRNYALPHPENAYLDLVGRVITHGALSPSRAGPTLRIPGETLRFPLGDSFPLLTTKKVFLEGVIRELLWFVSGSTDAQKLRDQGVHIWDGNGSREYLDGKGFTDRREYELGPVYGFQWRHFGGNWRNEEVGGFDQIKYVADKLRNDRHSRQIVLSAWNPPDLKDMALPPCHYSAVFTVIDGEIHTSLQMRSSDLGLGLPFNIASYALLTCMLAKVSGLRPSSLTINIADAHVYLDHVEPLKEQLKRNPRPFPTLRILRDTDNIDDFVYEDFLVENYNPHPPIKMKMSAGH